MSSSSASQTSGAVRCSGLTASRGRRYSRTSSAVHFAAADDPLEEAGVLVRDFERRVARADATGRVRQPQQVAVRHAVAPAVLDAW